MKKDFFWYRIFLFAFLLTQLGCAGYISKMHQQMDRENDQRRIGHINPNDPFHRYRQGTQRQSHFQGKPQTLSSFKNSPQPTQQRQYRQVESRRHTTQDLYDNDNSGSLWSSSGQQNFLFAKNKKKRSGDIVILKVQGSLKTEIARELARVTPRFLLRQTQKEKDKNKADSNEDDKGKNGENKKSQKTNEDEDLEANDVEKVYDHISTVVVEEIRVDHLLLRGQKEVLFKKKKHIVEVQVLVNRNEIDDQDSVYSSKAVESSVNVLR